MSPASLDAVRLLALTSLLAAACAGAYKDVSGPKEILHNVHNVRNVPSLGITGVLSGCLYEGRWFTEGAGVPMRVACLRCACYRGALTCRRRSCSPLPDPPPKRCHVLHRKGTCCPELHCPDGVTVMENIATAKIETDDLSDIVTPASTTHACVEGGTVYAAGSAMSSKVACEQCFCLGAARRCVRPQCLPSPPGCRPIPSSGACCPQRYFCEHMSTRPPDQKHIHECEVNGHWITEGERVLTPENNCTQCFCLRGAVRCQPLACAPPLLGCKPLLQFGECCPHQYQCDHKPSVAYQTQIILDNALADPRKDVSAFHTPKSTKQETTTKNVLTIINTPTTSISSNHLIATTKVKRKTNDPPPHSSQTLSNTTNKTAAAKLTALTEETTTEIVTEILTEQPEGTVKIMINGTINCTTELSSTLGMTVNDTLPLNMTVKDREKNDASNLETHTFSPNDIITNRNVDGFEENETFTINVTSSLITNTSRSTKPPMATVSKIPLPADLVDALNSSKKTKGDYDYDYTEPTLPPSLPNLKIIPFVAADAVVEDEPLKETLTYPILEREDKFPIYYPSIDTKDTAYATRRTDVYNPTQYPVFVSDKKSRYPSLTDKVNPSNTGYVKNDNDLEYTVSTSLGNRISQVKKSVTVLPTKISTFGLDTPAVNLFSPPEETQGGFVPKDPGIIDDHYAAYSSTPPGSSMLHLTTSMQLDVAKGECVSGDGQHLLEGASITLACSECTCAWGELHCSPRLCHTPTGCRRRPDSSNAADLCCGELICNEENKTTLPPVALQKKIVNDTKVKIENITSAMKVDTPPDHNLTNINFTEIMENTGISDNLFINYNENTTLRNTTKVIPTPIINSEKNTTESISITTAAIPEQISQTTYSQDYDEDEEDEGFSFGSVLKLLLSENYKTTTVESKRPFTSTTNAPTKVADNTATLPPFIPLPPRPYIPPSKIPTTVNRIDHLVLGEATAIKTSTQPTTTIKSNSKPTTQRINTKLPVNSKNDDQPVQYTSVNHEDPRPPSVGGIGAGLLKLAGCNIYGRMYRVGRIIAELSTPCQECWCTEFGVQCKPLKC